MTYIIDFCKVWNKPFYTSLQNTPRIHSLDDNKYAAEFSLNFDQIIQCGDIVAKN